MHGQVIFAYIAKSPCTLNIWSGQFMAYTVLVPKVNFDSLTFRFVHDLADAAVDAVSINLPIIMLIMYTFSTPCMYTQVVY